jgi:hypothetical protein
MATRTKLVDRIYVPYGNRSKLAKQFGVTLQTVRCACNFASPSCKRHDDIRRAALEHYGGHKIKVTSVITT